MGRVKEIHSKIIKAKNVSKVHKKNHTPRIKMPNFDAIHKRQFKQMESLFDHVARKQERAKELLKSTIKKSTKKPLVALNENETQVNSNSSLKLKSERKLSPINLPIPTTSAVSKARQKINFTKNDKVQINSNSSLKLKSERKLLPINLAIPTASAVSKARQKINFTNDKVEKNLKNIKIVENQRSNKENNLVKTKIHAKSRKSNDSNVSKKESDMIKTEKIDDMKINLKSTKNHYLTSHNTNNEQKMEIKDNSLQKQSKHKLYKTRQDLSSNKEITMEEKKKIKNVRSNRRFELLMKFRNSK